VTCFNVSFVVRKQPRYHTGEGREDG